MDDCRNGVDAERFVEPFCIVAFTSRFSCGVGPSGRGVWVPPPVRVKSPDEVAATIEAVTAKWPQVQPAYVAERGRHHVYTAGRFQTFRNEDLLPR